ncbi:alpha/beta fold hydrolase [Rhizobium leguminosarum]|jgi:3-oxoadipate enol-lactonase|uniref:alpha/beta fold hydrolase n=1 Tax=Rhizobium TaxID=379 RepID=UPI000362D854|nr:alpha/beta hydrolase [Rhizobium leguminosarum]MBY2907821.1 alpha/beta fold hydrolase [Rhizobium leguminosarum]MBY2915812.1 alpha/beta fold hydrolase [Rhizobium leguminosarum]MBY2922241.1 alpha/beta fold hydrolase [Rhizobium leguminosarum]MBY2942035.1 alpha/beta fold hydrolase [Rhizobium leguminosarum]MBY2965061.1 alpha/beta fold hydrolase [Rhizobium leguminosarum]
MSMSNSAANARETASGVAYARTSDGIGLAYRRSGRPGGPRVVLIHSLALDASVWDRVVGRLEDADIVTMDCRGHGRSDKPAGPYDVERFGDDIADLMGELGWSDAVVAGCSMGGCVAQTFAARHPELVRAMLLIDTTAWYGANAPTEWRARAAKARSEGLASMAEFQATRWFGDRFRMDHPAQVQHAMSVFTANDIDAYAATCAMLGDADLRRHLGGFLFPVSVVVGEEDYATPVETARDLAAAIPGASLTVLPAARHLTPIECPDQIADAIRSLFKRTNG